MSHNLLMQGFPPSPESQVSLANWRKSPFNKWSFSHVREIVPSTEIRSAGSASVPLPQNLVDLSHLTISLRDEKKNWREFLEHTHTDNMVILHQGRIVYEYYRPDLDAATPHILMSVSKSMLGLIFGIAVNQGKLQPDQLLTDWIPELGESVYAGASLRDLLDMRVGVQFDEDYQAVQGAIIAYRKAQGWEPLARDETPSDLRSFFSSLNEADGEHGGRFHYVSPNTDLLGWVLERACQERYADLMSRLLWQPIGAEHDGYITVDRFGAPRCAGGQCVTARDLARVGLLFANAGKVGDRQIVPTNWLEDILSPTNQVELCKAWDEGDFADHLAPSKIHYRNQWYVLHEKKKILFAWGVFGQNLFVDFNSDTVIAKLSSQPMAVDLLGMDWTLAAVRSVGLHLAG